MSTLKTIPNDQDAEKFIGSIEDENRKADAFELFLWMKSITGEQPVMWGNSIIGFGKYHYTYDSGREGDWFIVGFSPRKQNISIYFISGFRQLEDQMQVLGKFKTGKSCLYIKRLTDIKIDVLKAMIERSYKLMQEKYNS